jgi:hypothetical protein
VDEYLARLTSHYLPSELHPMPLLGDQKMKIYEYHKMTHCLWCSHLRLVIFTSWGKLKFEPVPNQYLEYLHRSPASRRRQRKGNQLPGGITGVHKYGVLILQVRGWTKG